MVWKSGVWGWCQLNQRTSLSRAVQAGSQTVRHSDNVNTETGKLIDTVFVFISRSSSVRMTGAVTISSEEARGFLNAQHWRERFHQRLGLNKLYADGSTVGMLSNIVATELGQCFKVSSCNTFFFKNNNQHGLFSCNHSRFNPRHLFTMRRPRTLLGCSAYMDQDNLRGLHISILRR